MLQFLKTMKRKFTRTGKRKSYTNLGKILHLFKQNLDNGDVVDGRPLQNTSWLKLYILQRKGMLKAGPSGRAKVWVCGRSLAGMAGSNLVG